MIWDTVLNGVFKTLDKVIPDPVARAEAQRRLIEAENLKELEFFRGDLQLAVEQIKTNAVEAQNASLFVAGWRPGVGWVCVAGLGYQFLAQPLLAWGAGLGGYDAPPELELGDLLTLLFGMLGLSTLRTVEKKAGVAA